MDINAGFIGTGYMGSLMVRGIVKSGIILPDRIFIYDVDRIKSEALKNEMGVNVSNSSEDVVDKSDLVILAVKPNMIKPVLESCKSKFNDKKILVSIAAGIPIKTYKDIIGNSRKVFRAMPNTPAYVGEGMTAVSYDENVNDGDIKTVKIILNTIGKVEFLDEKFMSEVIALIGSSPAYVFIFIEAMADAAVLAGIPRNLAYNMAAQAVLGSAKMVLETGKHPGELKDQVCTPAGTTIEAVKALERSGFRYAVMEAMNECTRRAREIGKIYG